VGIFVYEEWVVEAYNEGTIPIEMSAYAICADTTPAEQKVRTCDFREMVVLQPGQEWARTISYDPSDPSYRVEVGSNGAMDVTADAPYDQPEPFYAVWTRDGGYPDEDILIVNASETEIVVQIECR